MLHRNIFLIKPQPKALPACLIGERRCCDGDIIRIVISESANEVQLSTDKARMLLERILSEQCRKTLNGSDIDGENTDSSVGG